MKLSQCHALHTLPILFMQIITSHMASIFSGQISVWMTTKLWYQTASLLSTLMKLYWTAVFSFLWIGYDNIIWYPPSLVMTSVFPSAVCLTVSGFLTQAVNPMWVDLPFAVLTWTHSAILCFCAVCFYTRLIPTSYIFCCSPVWNKCWPLHCSWIQSFCNELDFWSTAKTRILVMLQFLTYEILE